MALLSRGLAGGWVSRVLVMFSFSSASCSITFSKRRLLSASSTSTFHWEECQMYSRNREGSLVAYVVLSDVVDGTEYHWGHISAARLPQVHGAYLLAAHQSWRRPSRAVV